MNKIEVKKAIIFERNNGKSDQEIYFQLKQKYSDLKNIAILITATPLQTFKDKYKTYNGFLAALLVFNTLFKIIFLINLSSAQNIIKLVLMSAEPIAYIIFAIQIFNFTASAYRSCGTLTIIFLLLRFFNYPSNILMLIDLIFVSFIIFLSFYLASKLFPYYNPKSLKIDRNGDYMLSNINTEIK